MKDVDLKNSAEVEGAEGYYPEPDENYEAMASADRKAYYRTLIGEGQSAA